MKSKEQIIVKLKELIEEISLGMVKAATIHPNAQIIAELGMDSLDYATLMLSCEGWLGIRIKEDSVKWQEIRTIDDLAEMLEKQQ